MCRHRSRRRGCNLRLWNNTLLPRRQQLQFYFFPQNNSSWCVLNSRVVTPLIGNQITNVMRIISKQFISAIEQIWTYSHWGICSMQRISNPFINFTNGWKMRLTSQDGQVFFSYVSRTPHIGYKGHGIWDMSHHVMHVGTWDMARHGTTKWLLLLLVIVHSKTQH